MDKMTFMDELFLNQNIKITDMHKGLTNQNFLLNMKNESFVLRTPRCDSDRIVNRHYEALALQAIANEDIDAETIYYDEVSGYKVTRYIQDAKDFYEYTKTDKIERVAHLMKHFHSLHKKIGIEFDPVKQYAQYKSFVKEPLYNLSFYEAILNEVLDLTYEKVLCHNDWVEGNILFTEQKTYLIDYEYACDNDPLFDVMSFLTENKIEDEQMRKRFYSIYFDEMNHDLWHRLNVWETYHNLLWCMWAMMMWEQRHDTVYKTIAHDKYQALKNGYIGR